MAEATKILSSGIDTMNFSADLAWKDTSFFEYLTELKREAKNKETEVPGVVQGIDNNKIWLFLLKPFGAEGYEWILIGKEFTLKIGNWQEPKSRPGVIVNIRSETLWRKGARESCERIIRLIEKNGAAILTKKVSRADLCIDIMLEKDIFDIGLRKNITKKAKKWGIIFGASDNIETVQVGMKGKLIARLYDKEIEIREKSKKTWMYDIWAVEKIEKNKLIVRVEFELKRDVVKEMGLGDLNDFLSRCDEAWAYCTKKWLKFEINKDQHHRKRKVLDWWKVVQNGFYGVQDPYPAIRKKAIKEDADQLRNQIVGYATSLTAITLDKYEFESEETVSFEDCINSVIESYQRDGKGEDDFKELLMKKRAKYLRTKERKR